MGGRRGLSHTQGQRDKRPVSSLCRGPNEGPPSQPILTLTGSAGPQVSPRQPPTLAPPGSRPPPLRSRQGRLWDEPRRPSRDIRAVHLTVGQVLPAGPLGLKVQVGTGPRRPHWSPTGATVEPPPRGTRAEESAQVRNRCCPRGRHRDRPPPRDQSKAWGPPGTCRGAQLPDAGGGLCLPAPAGTTVLQHTRGGSTRRGVRQYREGFLREPPVEPGPRAQLPSPRLVPPAWYEWATLVRRRDRSGHTDKGHRPHSPGTARPVPSACGPSRGVLALSHADGP